MLALLVALAACGAPPTRFSEANARAHVNILAGTIGSRPAGTDANRRAREYLVDQLRLFGFEVRVQEADASRPELGQTARVSNIIATRQGRRPEAVALVAHYDSPPDSPGAADDGLGVAVCLEAGRRLAARQRPAWTLAVLLTDGEELGLMGAAALLQDPVMKQVRAYLNFEAVGSAGPSLLFQAGPGNAWLTGAWARHAPRPAGGSFATEIYKRLPNDTDFTVLQRSGAPGLNFAPTDDGYSYHTARDTPERLSQATLLDTGANAVAMVEALDRMDITERADDTLTYFDVGRSGALAFGGFGEVLLAVVSVIAGLAAWVRLLVAGRKHGGLLQLVAGALWVLGAAAAAAGAAAGASWLLREAREVYHPWYASPNRLFVLLALAGGFGVWVIRRVRLWLPRRARGTAGPSIVWVPVLPAWIALAVVLHVAAPSASYLATVPLLAAGALLAAVPLASSASVRLASVVVLAVAGSLWVAPGVDLLRFAVTAFGRMPFVTPAVAHPVLVLAVAVYLAPPLAALVAGMVHKRWTRRAAAAVLFLALALSAGMAYVAPAYTEERPLHRVARYLNDVVGGRAYWEVASVEPGIDLPGQAPGAEAWQVARAPAPASYPLGMPGPAFAFRSRTTLVSEPPADVQGTIAMDGSEARLEVTAFPREQGLLVAVGLPGDAVPIEANLPGRSREGRWVAAYAAPPLDGLTFRARFRADQAERLKDARVLVIAPGLPGGEGWQRLPRWLASPRTVWTARSVYILPAVR